MKHCHMSNKPEMFSEVHHQQALANVLFGLICLIKCTDSLMHTWQHQEPSIVLLGGKSLSRVEEGQIWSKS